MEHVILVDESGAPTGTAEKLVAHESPGLLHLAFSVFVYDGEGRVLLQRRAAQKHHFRNRWSNTCCSHPSPGEAAVEAGQRRLMEEMGIDLDLRVVGRFTYRAEDPESGLVEHEVDDVLTGAYIGEPRPNPNEVSAWRWADIGLIEADLADQPDEYTPWLLPALQVLRTPRTPDWSKPSLRQAALWL
ncbi:MAG: isopentenyl-diphosphate Delta-isomerase [Acidimicrobiia bacterium]